MEISQAFSAVIATPQRLEAFRLGASYRLHTRSLRQLDTQIRRTRSNNGNDLLTHLRETRTPSTVTLVVTSHPDLHVL